MSYLLNCLTNADLQDISAPLHLNVLWQQAGLKVFHLIEPRMLLVLGIHKVLDLGHRKLAHTKQSGSRGDFVSETASDLRARKGQSAVVEVKKSAKVDKVALSSFGTEVALELSSWTDAAVEHEIELDWLADGVVGVGVFDVMIADECTEFGAGVIVDL